MSLYLHPGDTLILFLVITIPVVLCWWGFGSNIACHVVVGGAGLVVAHGGGCKCGGEEGAAEEGAEGGEGGVALGR